MAYLDAVREIGQTVGHHPGLLILDEPRQQDIEPADHAAMLQYLARGAANDGQVIVTRATARAELDQMLPAISVHITDIGERRLLQPESASDTPDAE